MTTPEEQQKHQDTHQQSQGGDDDDVVVVTCLHCKLIDTIDGWIKEYNEKTGQPVCMNQVAGFIGAAVETYLADIREHNGARAADIIDQAIDQGRIQQRARIEASAPPVEPNLNTHH